MGFEDALRESSPPREVGDVRLRYESPLLIGECRTGPAPLLPELLLALAVAAAIAAGALLLFYRGPGDFPWLELALATLAAGLVASAARVKARDRHRRRFVLNFSDETLRLEGFAAPHHLRPTVTLCPFDDVEEVEVEGDGAGFQLTVRLRRHGQAQGTVLVKQVPGEQIAELRQLWRLLRAAFGIRAPSSRG